MEPRASLTKPYKTVCELIIATRDSDERKKLMIEALLVDNNEYMRLIESLYDLQEVTDAFPQFTEQLIQRLLTQFSEYQRLIRNRFELRDALETYPHHADTLLKPILSCESEYIRLMESEKLIPEYVNALATTLGRVLPPRLNTFLRTSAILTFKSNLEKASLLKIHYLFNAHGNLLNYPGKVLPQKGPHCGYYAAYYAALFHYQQAAALFPHPLTYPRKKDTLPKAKYSLRTLHKKQEKIGIYSADEMLQIIRLTGCNGIIASVNNFEQFKATIYHALENSLPILLPYSINQYHPSTNPSNAHWGTVIGICKKTPGFPASLCVMTHGNYIVYRLDKIYQSFFDIDNHFPRLQFYKKPGGEWEVDEGTPPQSSLLKRYTVGYKDLRFFSRKLIIVQPPTCHLRTVEFK